MKKQNIPILFFIIVAVFLCIYIIYIPPVRGVADQGDFERIMMPTGLNYFGGQVHSMYDFIHQRYDMSFVYPGHKLAYIPYLLGIIPTTTYIYPITIAKLLCMPIGYFDTRVLAGVMCVNYIIIVALLLRRINVKSVVSKVIIYIAVLLVFFDGIYVTMFNSLYGQSIMLVSFALFLLAAVNLIEHIENLRKRDLILFLVSCIFLLGSKLQCFVFLPFFIVIWLYLCKKSPRKTFVIVLTIFTVWYGVGNYVINGTSLNMDTQYNSVFYGILKDSPDPTADLVSLGLDTELAADAGKHSYLEPEEYKYVPRSDILKDKFYSQMSNGKLIKFYLTHPSRLIKAMEITANHAFTNKISLGTFEESAGMDSGAFSYRFDIWENIRGMYPKTLAFIIPMYVLFLAIGLYEGVKKRNLYGYLFLIILMMGAIQFPMPYLGNGNADIIKQLFLFNVVFDLGLFVSAYYGGAKLYRKIRRLHQ